MQLIDEIPWLIIILLCCTLGLAPFYPVPHLFEKISMLLSGTLKRPIDIFDLFFHGIPFIMLALKIVRYFTQGK